MTTNPACSISPLTGVDGGKLYDCFMEAFSDYQVPVSMDRRAFDWNNALRGFAPEFSVGAFVDGRLAGFILSGRGIWQGRRTAYDMGTGVIPSCRGRGLSKSLLSALARQLEAHGVGSYLLEVLKTNTTAFNLYKNDGFSITRGFLCFRAERAAALEKLSGSELPHGFSFGALQDTPDSRPEFCDWTASWQNSSDALRRYPGPVERFGVFFGGELAAYGAAKLAGGDIPQIAVRKDFRRRGIGRALLLKLLISMTDKKKVSVINIDEGDSASAAFFRRSGFGPLTEQFEMMKNFPWLGR